MKECLNGDEKCYPMHQFIRGKVKHELRVTSYKFKSTSYEFKSTSYEFKSMSYEFKSTSYKFKYTTYEFKSTSGEFKSTSYEYDFTSYEFKLTNYEFKSTSSRIINSMKTHRNSLTNYLGSELMSVAYLRFSAETCKVWVEAISFSRIIFRLASFSNSQKLILFYGCAKRRLECSCFSEYCIQWNTKTLFFLVKINVNVGWNKHYGEKF